MKITKTTEENTTTYFYNGIKKYSHYKDSGGNEIWREYDKNNNQIHFKNSDGHEIWKEYDKNGNQIHYKNSNKYETWSDDNPKNPKNKELKKEDIKPFEFSN